MQWDQRWLGCNSNIKLHGGNVKGGGIAQLVSRPPLILVTWV